MAAPIPAVMAAYINISSHKEKVPKTREAKGVVNSNIQPDQASGSQSVLATLARTPTIIIGGCTDKIGRLVSSETTDG